MSGDRAVIFHIHKDRDYTSIINDIFNDEKLSAEALGLLCYLLSRPENWRVVPNQLRARFKLGEHKFQRLMRELVAAGHARKRQRRDKLTKQWNGSEYDVYETPQRQKQRKINRLPSREGDFPGLGKPPPQDTKTNRLLRVADRRRKRRLGSKEDRRLEDSSLADFDDFETYPGPKDTLQ